MADGVSPAAMTSKFENVHWLTASGGGPFCSQVLVSVTDGVVPAVAKELTDGYVPPDVQLMLSEFCPRLLTTSDYSP